MKPFDQHEYSVSRWSFDTALAALPLALIVVGPALEAHIEGRTLFVYASQIAAAALVVHIGFSVLRQGNYGGAPVAIRWLLLGTALLAVPILWAAVPGAGVVAYFNFAAGTVGGVAIAQVWKRVPLGYSWLDVGYAALLLGGIVQLFLSFAAAGSINALHQSSETRWGNSNFVAGCLVVAALILITRSVHMGRYRKLAITLALAAIGVALLTLSRGAVVAACIGAMFFLWSASAKRWPRGHRLSEKGSKRADFSIIATLISRLLAISVPVIAYLGVERVTTLRAQINDQVYENVRIRFALYKLAWDEFLRHPFTGTGWASFRDATVSAVGQSQTFAHNLVLSMLQIGGLLSVPYLAALAYLMYWALRRGGPYSAAIAASISMSMTDPFFESTAGNLIALPIAILAAFCIATADDKGESVSSNDGSANSKPILVADSRGRLKA